MGCLAPYAKYRCHQERLHQRVNSSHGFLAPTAADSSSISGVVRLSGGVRSDCENPAERTAVRSERPRSDRESGEDHRRDESRGPFILDATTASPIAALASERRENPIRVQS